MTSGAKDFPKESGAGAAKVFTIPASVPFAETLARGLIAQAGGDQGPLALSSTTIYLPTRRAARNFGDGFARVLGGAALLPEFKPLGDVDEDEFLFDSAADDFEFLPAINPIRRRLLLATLVRRWDERRGGRLGFAQAAALAGALAAVMDQIETQGASLEKLEALAPAHLAEHWAEVAQFLLLLRDAWPPVLQSEGALDPAKRRNQSLRALAQRLAANPPEKPVIAAGSTGSIPATGELLGVIARLPHGAVVLPGLDRTLDEQSWQNLDPGHPQFGMKQLLERIGVPRDAVTDWLADSPSSPRLTLLRETLRPAPTTDAWRALAEHGSEDIAAGLAGMSLLEAAEPAEEAALIALALRETLSKPGRTAALVTPDRSLARRVAAELGRWNIAVDDSAGLPLARTPPGVFLCLLAEAADAGFAPVPLLALLKHPLALLGDEPAVFRAQARALDICLRGPRPDPGLDGIANRIARAEAQASADERADLAGLSDWFKRLAGALNPLAEALAAPEIFLSDILAVHLQVAERIATDAAGSVHLWRGEAGEMAANVAVTLSRAARDLPPIDPGSYTPLLRSLLEERAVRPAFGRHPRLAILGPLEARLLHYDRIVLGGLNEGTWPAAASADPWFSRPMRKTLGLEQPERSIGLAAHDFAALAANRDVILTRATKSEGTPTVASRWLQRLLQLTRGLKIEGALRPAIDYHAIHTALADPGPQQPERRPAPRPPVAARPRRLSVTEIETWLRDPYAIYAKHVLRLRPLDPLDAAIGPLEKGSAVHRALELFIRKFPGAIPEEAESELALIADSVFHEFATPASVLALWRPRFRQAARWFVGVERERRAAIARSHVEIRGECVFEAPGGAFVLSGRADRIDELRSGGAAILDYKTGAPPTEPQVRALLSPQLPLEAAILAAGGFKSVGARETSELIYLRFAGGTVAGEIRPIKADAKTLAQDAVARLTARIAAFDDQTMAYPSRVAPWRARIAGDYDHLARVREWSLTGWQAPDE